MIDYLFLFHQRIFPQVTPGQTGSPKNHQRKTYDEWRSEIYLQARHWSSNKQCQNTEGSIFCK